MTVRARRMIGGILAAVCAAVLVVTFWPTPVDRPIHGQIITALSELHRAGVPPEVGYSAVEIAANVAFFVPFGVLVAVLMMPSLWWASGVFGLTLSLCVELTQYLFLPHRFASAGDLASNTAGAVIGGACVAGFRRLLRYGRPRPR